MILVKTKDPPQCLWHLIFTKFTFIYVSIMKQWFLRSNLNVLLLLTL